MYESSFYDMVDNLVNVILNTWFNRIRDPDLREDLKQEGYTKAYEMLKTGNYDPSRDLRTYIYTGIRNSMTNYLYHNNKESHLDIDEFYSVEDPQEFCSFSLDLNYVKKVCEKYSSYGNYINTVLNYFKNAGIYNGPLFDNISVKEIPYVKNAIIGEIIWKMLEV